VYAEVKEAERLRAKLRLPAPSQQTFGANSGTCSWRRRKRRRRRRRSVAEAATASAVGEEARAAAEAQVLSLLALPVQKVHK
jgi:hypothetical protein